MFRNLKTIILMACTILTSPWIGWNVGGRNTYERGCNYDNTNTDNITKVEFPKNVRLG